MSGSHLPETDLVPFQKFPFSRYLDPSFPDTPVVSTVGTDDVEN